MQEWEYLTVVVSGNPRYKLDVYSVNGEEMKDKTIFLDYLNELGKQGWELVVNRGDVYYFKRQKVSS
jgi:hypothetical protein